LSIAKTSVEMKNLVVEKFVLLNSKNKPINLAEDDKFPGIENEH
jgi:hypothetical protein